MILLKDVSYEWEDGRTALKNINLEIYGEGDPYSEDYEMELWIPIVKD